MTQPNSDQCSNQENPMTRSEQLHLVATMIRHGLYHPSINNLGILERLRILSALVQF